MVSSQKKKKVSKKLKSSWRKHSDIRDVEDFLEEERCEERIGPSLSTVPDETLFQINSKPEKYVTARQRKILAASKPLKCFSALQPHTKVPDPISKRNRVRTKKERASKFVKEKGIVKAKTRLAEANKKEQELNKNKPKRGEFNADIWASPDNDENVEWVEKNTEKHNLKGLSVPVPKVNYVKNKNSSVPAIELPHPGMSYNPSYSDHQDLLRQVADKEIKLIKKEEHLSRVTTGMFKKVTAEKRHQDWLLSMSENLPNKESKTEEDESDGEYKAVNPPVKNSKKSLKQRRKQKEQLEVIKARKALKQEKKKITDIHNLKLLITSVQTTTEKQVKLRELRKKKLELKKDKPKMLNAMKYEEPDLEFNLGQELSGNLKDLKTEGNILVDRFKSMQKRNILAPTKRHTFKKTKVKKYAKPGHKEDWKKTVARSFEVVKIK